LNGARHYDQGAIGITIQKQRQAGALQMLRELPGLLLPLSEGLHYQIRKQQSGVGV